MADEESVTPKAETREADRSGVHEVKFVAYPKLVFAWPLILAGLLFWPLGYAPASPSGPEAAMSAADEPAATEPAEAVAVRAVSPRLEALGWIYIWIAIVVVMTLGVDIDRNQFVFWLVVVGLFWVLGLWLKDAKGITVFGDIYRWFQNLDVQYDRALGLCVSVLLLVPLVILLVWAQLNSRWRITHNEFEHYSLGKMDDALGRGAKSIRASYPDVLELFLGLAGTLIVFNATGTRELRRINHVMFLPFVYRRLNLVLEKTAVTGMLAADEEEDEEEG